MLLWNLNFLHLKISKNVLLILLIIFFLGCREFSNPYDPAFLHSSLIELKTPTDNGIIPNTTMPILEWIGDESYSEFEIRLGTNPDFSTGLAVSTQNILETSYNVEIPLDNETIYSWQVRGRKDSASWGNWSEIGTFTISLEVPALLWNFKVDDYAFESIPAVMADGSLFAGCNDGKVYALRSDGTVRWTYETSGEITSSPTINSTGSIVFGSTDGFFYSLSSNGDLQWSIDTGSAIHGSPALTSDGSYYIINSLSDIYKIDSLGSIIWSLDLDDDNHIVLGSPVIDSTGWVYCTTNALSGGLHGIRSDGLESWSYSISNTINSTPALNDSYMLFIGDSSSNFHAINLNTRTSDWIYSNVGYIFSSPVIGSDGTIYLVSENEKLQALTPEGILKWEKFVGSSNLWRAPILVAENDVIYCLGGGILYALNSDGTEQWSIEIKSGEGNHNGGLTISSSGILFISGISNSVTIEGQIIAILTNSNGLADSPWPKFQKDYRNTGNKDN